MKPLLLCVALALAGCESKKAVTSDPEIDIIREIATATGSLSGCVTTIWEEGDSIISVAQAKAKLEKESLPGPATLLERELDSSEKILAAAKSDADKAIAQAKAVILKAEEAVKSRGSASRVLKRSLKDLRTYTNDTTAWREAFTRHAFNAAIYEGTPSGDVARTAYSQLRGEYPRMPLPEPLD